MFNRESKKNEKWGFEYVADKLKIDLIELLSRKVVDTTINEIVFRVKKNDNDAKQSLWESFVYELKEYNDLERIHKTDTKNKSMFGKSIVGFDMWENHPIIWFADNDNEAEALRINGLKQYCIVCNRTYSTFRGTPLLRNRLTITSNNTNYLFLAGFGVSPKEQKVINKMGKEKIELAKKEGWIPLNYCSLKLPKYVVDHFRVGTYEYDYGILPAQEMLNKDYLDSDTNNFYYNENGVYSNDIVFADWWPARDLIDFYNGFLQFFGSEMVLDHTRIIGTFSSNEINNFLGLNKKNNEKDIKSVLSRIKEDDPQVSAIKQRLILKSLGGEGSTLEKMQTTLKPLEYTQTLEDLLSLFFKVSGYSWDNKSNEVYENVSQTLNSTKGVYESTKEKIVLFERQWKEFYAKIAFVWFKQNGNPFNSFNECVKEFEENIEFNIVSNVLQQENNDYQKVVELKQNELISTYKAIKDLNPDMSNEELEEEVERIKEDKEANVKQWDNLDNNFNNQDFLGYEENNNPNVDGDKDE